MTLAILNKGALPNSCSVKLILNSLDIPEDPVKPYRAKGCVEATPRFTTVDINVILMQ